jgi:hypothetical protein
MTDNTYNGWTNRETWMVNLHWGDYWLQLVEDGDDIDGDTMRSDVEEFVDEALINMPEGQRLFLSDWIDLRAVNWWELSRHYEREEVQP